MLVQQIRVYGFGFSAIAKDAGSENENLASRSFSLYSGYKGVVNQSISESDNNFLVSSLYRITKGRHYSDKCRDYVSHQSIWW